MRLAPLTPHPVVLRLSGPRICRNIFFLLDADADDLTRTISTRYHESENSLRCHGGGSGITHPLLSRLLPMGFMTSNQLGDHARSGEASEYLGMQVADYGLRDASVLAGKRQTPLHVRSRGWGAKAQRPYQWRHWRGFASVHCPFFAFF